MRVAICFIGTGKYLNFLPKYYENIHKFFLPKTEKTFLVFTDGELENPPEDMIVYHQEHLEWPFVTLKRFEIINMAEDVIRNHDWFIFLDADTLVVDTVDESEIFTDKLLIGVHHPCHFLNMPPHNKFPGAFETNSESLACISDEDDTSVYFQGCFWGGKSSSAIQMIEELSKRIRGDLSRDVIAVWHDESHMNKYFSENINDIHVLGPSFAYPEVFSSHCDFEPKIVHLAKDNSKYQK